MVKKEATKDGILYDVQQLIRPPMKLEDAVEVLEELVEDLRDILSALKDDLRRQNRD